MKYLVSIKINCIYLTFPDLNKYEYVPIIFSFGSSYQNVSLT